MRFAFIAKHRGIWPVAWLCEALDVSRSGFHAWLNRGPSRRAQEDEVSHKGPRVREMIEAAGAELRYLPRYSPDFNPIENAFARLKALLRKAAERTVDRLWAAIGRIVDLFTPAECRNYFAHAGYDAI